MGVGNPPAYPRSMETLSNVKFPGKLLSMVKSNMKRQVKPPSLQALNLCFIMSISYSENPKYASPFCIIKKKS